MTGARLVRVTTALLALLVASAARAESVPDASLRAVQHRFVRLELDGAPAIEGRLLGFEADWVTVALPGSFEVVSVPRAQLLRLRLVEPPQARRIVSLQVSPLGTVVVDADYRRFHAFASTSLTMPILTASGSTTWLAAAVGGGLSLPLGKQTRWRFDAFGAAMPLRVTSHYTYLGFGVGGGLHYTTAAGFTFGFKAPLIGFATRLGHSPTGYDAPFRYNDSLSYYYLAAFAGLPMFTTGYRFN